MKFAGTQNPESYFEHLVFYNILDQAISSVTERFEKNNRN